MSSPLSTAVAILVIVVADVAVVATSVFLAERNYDRAFVFLQRFALVRTLFPDPDFRVVDRSGDDSRDYVVDLLLPLSIQSDVQANLAELMSIWIQAHGETKAKRIRRFQILRIIVGHYSTCLARMLGQAAGLIAGK